MQQNFASPRIDEAAFFRIRTPSSNEVFGTKIQGLSGVQLNGQTTFDNEWSFTAFALCSPWEKRT